MKPLHLPAVILWMIFDTFRQAWASRVFQVMLVVSLTVTLFCLSAGVEGNVRLDHSHGFLPAADPEAETARRKGLGIVGGQLSLGFGLVTVPFSRDATDAVRLMHVVLAGFAAGTVGLLLTLVWTAGFLPAFLHPSAVTVVLTRPAPRWALLLGKFLGVLLFVTVQAGFFVVGTWLALAIRTGVVDGRYLLTAPLLVFEFGLFYTCSALLAVSARSTVACAFGTLLFWAVCFGVNFGHNALTELHAAETAAGKPASLPRSARWASEACYWVLPKPHDFLLIQFVVMGADDYQEAGVSPETLKALPVAASLLSSLLFPAFLLASAWWEFREKEF
jgi:ABC-type transport system involved in multi-copper enzyme maturation permease subunit